MHLRSESTWIYVIVLIMVTFAFVQGIRTIKNLDWPYDEDLYRNIAHAQTIVDGDFFGCDQYIGEKNWYNPLVPSIVAGLHRITNIPIHRLYTRAGAYLNLFAPFLFFILLIRFSDRWIALAALFAYLFVTSNGVPSWFSATYSPWLLPVLFVQSLFYLGVIYLSKAINEQKWIWYILTGVLLGLCFLGHTAPAMLLGFMICWTAVLQFIQYIKEKSDWSRIFVLIKKTASVFIVAFITGIPFIYIILFHYKLNILNPIPSNWVHEPLLLSNLGQFNWDLVSRFPFILFVIIGIFALIRVKEKRWERNLLLMWLVFSAGFIYFNFLWQWLRLNDIHVTRALPGYHFVFYLKGMMSILFGYGVIWTFQWIIKRFRQWMKGKDRFKSIETRLGTNFEKWMILFFLLLVFIKVYPSFMARDDYISYRVRMNERQDFQNAFHWIQENTTADDVFWSPDFAARLIVMPAGRKVVVVRPVFSNLYVDWKSRSTAHDTLYSSLINGDKQSFDTFAEAYQLRYILTFDETEEVDNANPLFVEKVFKDGKLCIYRYNES